MMRLTDGLTLAAAKLRAHRVRTGIVTAIVALLFAGIVAVLAVTAGVVGSLKSFGQEGLGSRYIVKAKPIIDESISFGTVKSISDQMKTENDQLIVKKKAEAKRLGLDYDSKTDGTLPIQPIESDNPKVAGQTTQLNLTSPIVQKAIKNYVNDQKEVSYTAFEKLAKADGAKKTFRSVNNEQMFMPPEVSGKVMPIINGKEQSTDTEKDNADMFMPNNSSPQNWAYFDVDLLKPFLLPDQNLEVGSGDEIPIIAPVNEAEKMIGLKPPVATASAKQQLDHLRKLREQSAGKTAQLCYRNQASVELLSQAKSQASEIERNKNNRNYTPPALQYNVPTTPCGEVTVKKDTRSAEEKRFTNNQTSFKKQFENYEDPVQGLISVRIVGLVPTVDYSASFSVKDIVQSVMRSSLGQGWFVPIDAVKQDSLGARVSPVLSQSSPMTQLYYAEFSDYQSAKQFTKNNVCDVQLSAKEMMSYNPYKTDPRVEKCYAAKKYFDISAFGNNASAIEDLRRGVWKVVRVVAPVVLLLAALVLMGIVGKIIADSRRETAVFRALGATRSSIAQVYLTYSLFIALFIAALAGVIGGLVAWLINLRFSPDISVSAVLAYNAADTGKKFTLFGVDPLYVVLVLALIIGAALLSTLIPLLTNVRRNPIRDMRDE